MNARLPDVVVPGDPQAVQAHASAAKPPAPAVGRASSLLDRLFGRFLAQVTGTGAPDAPASTAAKSGAKTERKPERKAATIGDRRRMGQQPPSFTELLPYEGFDPEDQCFVMADGATLGALFELKAIPTEARSHEYLAERAAKVQEALQAISEEDTSPWVVQFFANDDLDVSVLGQELRDYVDKVHADYPERRAMVQASAITQAVMQMFDEHLKQVSNPKGLFKDEVVCKQPWRGQRRRVRVCLYRRFARSDSESTTAREQLDAVASTLMATLTEAGCKPRRCAAKDLYEWLLPFFNPDVPWANSYAGELLKRMPYPGDRSVSEDGASEAAQGRTQAPIFGWDLAEMLNLSEPKSNLEAGCYEFDGRPVKALALQSMRQQPQLGHFSAELQSGDESYARLDRLPAGSMLSISVTIAPQNKLEAHVERIRDKSRANTPTARETFHECERVLERMIQGDKLFPMQLMLFLSAPSHAQLKESMNQARSMLNPSGLKFVENANELLPLDTFLRGLPFNFDPLFDQRDLRRTKLTFASHVAALLPVYGRSHGTPHPGIWFWNRGGEPLWVDPLNKRDRKKSAHLLLLGPTGAGKSATANYLFMQMMAVHRARLIIADAGNSFGLTVAYFKSLGLSTHIVNLTGNGDVSLPPFLFALRLLDDQELVASFVEAEQQARANAGLPEDDLLAALTSGGKELPAWNGSGPRQEGVDDDAAEQTREATDGQAKEDEDKRDYLGEMLISAVMMITGGEKSETDRMGRADRYLISLAIFRAAITAKARNAAHPLTQDVAIALMNMGNDETLSPSRRSRAEEMGQSMMTFTQGLRGKLFNRYGEDWPDADVTLVEMGTLTKDGYEDALAVAYSSLLDSVQLRGERFVEEGRPIVMATDEGHLITKSELLGPKIAKGTKMWRKLGIWFWLFTQNLQDFPDSMSRVLSMCEYWILLTMDESEAAEVARFKNLTTEQRRMLASAKKEPGKYTEGVLLSASEQWLFRNVPPAIPIALAMTEDHEKSHRRRIMNATGCTELQAALKVAEGLAQSRGLS